MPSLSDVTSNAVQAMSIKYNTMVYDLKRQGKQVVVMSLGEAYFDIPLLPMDDLPYPEIYHYSHSLGIPELRECLAGYFRTQYDVPVDPEREILITAGSKAAIHMALMAVLNPRDEVIIHEPAWVSYPEQVRLCYGVPVHVPYNQTVYDFGDYITNKTKAIIVNNPNNPRGFVFAEMELRHLLMLAEKHNLWIFSDEAYSDFLVGDSFISLGRLDREKRHAVIFNSISKNYGISGWRLGYVIANPDLIHNVLKVNQHLITCPATILEHYVAKHFHRILEITMPQIHQVVRKRARLAEYMDEIGLNYLAGTATFYFFVSTAPSQLTSEEFCTRLLQEDHVSVVPGLGYGGSCDKFVRVSVGTASLEENMFGLRRIKKLIDDTSLPCGKNHHGVAVESSPVRNGRL
ncbi:MAG: pyridoxal phosphate-dependent aminotransferase [Planctomycetota bacterium]